MMTPQQVPALDRNEIETLVGTKINDIELYQRAFTHKSALKRYNLSSSFELLEFLGDSVLNFIITRYLIDTYQGEDEGFLTKLRTRLVRGNTLADVGRKLGLDKYILMDEKGDRNGWNNNANILEDVFESLVGAIYSDIGLAHAKMFVLRIFTNPAIVDISQLETLDDNYKDRLMRECQTCKFGLPTYVLIRRDGIHFIVQVQLTGYLMGVGNANTKKAAEQNAAFNTLKMMNVL